MKPALLIRGMFGLGDNLHQRAALRILKETHSITLETMWASLYHDLIGDDLKIVRRPAALRTQLKNASRESHLFSPPPAALPSHALRPSYSTGTIERTQSKTVLEAMFASLGIQARYPEADIRFPVKLEWREQIERMISSWQTNGKPIMIYRPLCQRPEWPGGTLRNADPHAYAELAAPLRDRYFIVSVADFEPSKEWLVGPPFPADLCLHKGELPFELMAALFRRAGLVYTSGGFAAVLAAAVEVPCISIKGGFEPISWHADCAKWAPYLAIPPIIECRCGTSACQNRCGKQIDVPAGATAISRFLDNLPKSPAIIRARPPLRLPDVTLVSVETQTHELARVALADAVAKVEFGGVLIYTDKPDLIRLPNARYVEVPNWPDKIKMGSFYYTEAAAPITTSHALLMEWDAGIRDVSMWDPDFLSYDYIGAPWPGKLYGGWEPTGGFTVGNGGFALVSKRLAGYIYTNRNRFTINTDIGISRTYRGEFERVLGAKWAPEHVAWRFAFECGPPSQAIKPTFGFHDVFNWHLALPREDVIRRTRLLLANEYIVTKTPKLNLLARSTPWIREAIPEFAAAEARCERPLPQARHLQGRDSIGRLIRNLPSTVRSLEPGIGVVARNPNAVRDAYQTEMRRRGLKA